MNVMISREYDKDGNRSPPPPVPPFCSLERIREERARDGMRSGRATARGSEERTIMQIQTKEERTRHHVHARTAACAPAKNRLIVVYMG